MDIARLASTAYTAQNYPVPTGGHGCALEQISEVGTSHPAGDTAERVVQGEILQREHTIYGSTWDYLGSRVFDGVYGMADGGMPHGGMPDGGMPDGGMVNGATDTQKHSSPNQSAHAVGAYLSHTREFIQSDSGRGKQVDYFV